MKLYPLDPEHLQNLEASQFITRLFKDMESVKADIEKDKEMNIAFQTLNTQSAAFYKSLNQISAMAESKELETLDLERDRKISTIHLHIASYKYRDESEIKNAFAAANIILDKYEAMESLNYEAESTAIQKFLDEWSKGEHIVHIKALSLQLHLSNLKKAASAFDNVFNNRSAITTSKEVLDARLLKKQMLETYKSIAKYILAMAAFKKDTNLYPPLLDALNNGRKYFGDILARRKGNGGKDAPDAPKEG